MSATQDMMFNDSSSPLPSPEIATTYMYRNLPRKCTVWTLVAELELYTLRTSFNFVYVPWDKKTTKTMGYAFVNFVNPAIAQEVCRRMDSKDWRTVGHKREMKVAPARLQGLQQNLARYSQADEPDDGHFPVVFVDGKAVGLQAALQKFCGSSSSPVEVNDGASVQPRTSSASVWSYAESSAGPDEQSLFSDPIAESAPSLGKPMAPCLKAWAQRPVQHLRSFGAAAAQPPSCAHNLVGRAPPGLEQTPLGSGQQLTARAPSQHTAQGRTCAAAPPGLLDMRDVSTTKQRPSAGIVASDAHAVQRRSTGSAAEMGWSPYAGAVGRPSRPEQAMGARCAMDCLAPCTGLVLGAALKPQEPPTTSMGPAEEHLLNIKSSPGYRMAWQQVNDMLVRLSSSCSGASNFSVISRPIV